MHWKFLSEDSCVNFTDSGAIFAQVRESTGIVIFIPPDKEQEIRKSEKSSLVGQPDVGWELFLYYSLNISYDGDEAKKNSESCNSSV